MSRDSTRIDLLPHQNQTFIEMDGEDLTLVQYDDTVGEQRIEIASHYVPAFIKALEAAFRQISEGR